ncbi:MAG TPA: serine/threonine-protein kinase [bacterium]
MLPERIGRYRVVSEIGSGAMAAICLARDENLNRDVAIKILHSHLSSKQENILRFHREAHAVAKLQHANIVQIYDYSGPDSDIHYIVSEFVDGLDLSQVLKKADPLPVVAASIIVFELSDAVYYAHSHGIIHRDIKLENVIVGKDGTVKLTDFGIAHIFDWDKMTLPGALIGSPYYIAPEIIKGDSAGISSDIFSIGVLFYRILTGGFPFQGNNPAQVLKAVLSEVPPEPERVNNAVDRELSRLIMECVQKDPKKRPKAVDWIRAMLREYLKPFGIENQKMELSLFYASPADYLYLRKGMFASRLIEAAKGFRRVRAHHQVINLLNRALSLGPQDREVKNMLNSARFRQRLWLYPITALASVILVFSGIKIYEKVHFSAIREKGIITVVTENKSPEAVSIEKAVTKPVKAAKQMPIVPPPSSPESIAEIQALSEISLSQESGRLIVRTNPWSDVYVNGRFVGRTPFLDKIELSPGKHILEARNPYADVFKKEIEINPGALHEENITLQLFPGKLSIKLNKDASVYIDGKLIGRGRDFSGLLLMQGKHAVRVEKDGFRPVEMPVDITAGMSSDLVLDLVREPVFWKN